MIPMPTDAMPTGVDDVARALVAGPPPGSEGHPPPGAVVGLQLDGVRTVGVAGRVDGAAAASPMTRDTRHD
ncbi:MAG: hypothetical protein KJ548_03160, partial [Actinobacteria bacterium]|nr:hypothetical protein [Actinomycetota bacterium]